MKNIKLIIENQDVLTEELSNIFGGQDVGKKDKVIGDIYSNNYNMNLISEYILGTDMFNDKKCLDCLLLPICDGGCNLRRLEYKISNKPYDLCPIDTANMDTLLDMFYEKEIKN